MSESSSARASKAACTPIATTLTESAVSPAAAQAASIARRTSASGDRSSPATGRVTIGCPAPTGSVAVASIAVPRMLTATPVMTVRRTP